MNIVLAAYEFPPSRSPQALRWRALTRELARMGHSVTVLTVSQGAEEAAGTASSKSAWAKEGGVTILRTPARPMSRVLSAMRFLMTGGRAPSAPLEIPRRFQGLNWKGRAVAVIGRLLEWGSFPDLRGLWNATAGPALELLIHADRPDIVITSHEPASVLLLGRAALRAGIPWAADLGDPIDADYLPLRWRRRARRLEREVCSRCSLVMVTTDRYARKLQAVHGLDAARGLVLRQGFFPDGSAPERECEGFDAGRLELLYTGQLYRFRSPDALLEALDGLADVRLTIFSPQAELLRGAAHHLGGRLRLMSPVAPAAAMRWQRGAGILVNIGNTMPLQVPGKLFEYLGSGRPILHLAACEPDEAGDLVRQRRRGWVVDNSAGAIRAALTHLRALWRAGRLEERLDLAGSAVADFSWPALGARLSDSLAKVVEQGTRHKNA